MRRLLVCLHLCLSCLCQFALAEDLPRWQANAALQASMQSALDARWGRYFEGDQPRPRVQSMDLADYVLDAVAIGHRPDRTLRVLQVLSGMFDRDASSRNYGNMHWYYGDQRLVDRNGIEFAMRRLVLVPLLFADRLDAAQRSELAGILALARTGLTRHAVAITYTNIFLMKTWNLVALGEATGDAALVQQGRTMLRDWLRHTARTGINEFLSPTYYEVDLDCLALLANLSRDAETRRMARDGLNYLWHDIALHWFGLGARLGGVHSRDYDRLLNNAGAFQAKLAEVGWLGGGKAPRQAAEQMPYRFYATHLPTAAAAAWLKGPFPRFISQRWGEAPEKRLAHYMGQRFGISSAESGYTAGHDTAPLAINMGGGAEVPLITFLMDGRRDYYGVNKTLEAGSGHMKALHLRPFVSSVQNDNEVLFLASIQNDVASNAALESSITLPADAEYWLGEQKLALFNQHSAWNQDVPPNGKSTRIRVVDNADGSSDVHLDDEDDKLGVGLSRHFAVEPGASYRLGASLLGGDVFLYLNFYDAAQRLIGGEHAQRVSGGAAGYMWRSYSYVAPPGAVSVKAWLYSTTGNRTALKIRDLRFERMRGEDVDKLLGAFDFRAYRPQQVALPEGSPLVLRRENVAVALRPLGTLDVNGQRVPWTLYNDGLPYQAMRITARHAEGAQAGRGSTAVWAYAEEGIDSEAAFAAFRKRVAAVQAAVRVDGAQVEVKADGVTGALRLVSDVERAQRLVREGHKRVPDDAVLWVNGVDLARSLLANWLAD